MTMIPEAIDDLEDPGLKVAGAKPTTGVDIDGGLGTGDRIMTILLGLMNPGLKLAGAKPTTGVDVDGGLGTGDNAETNYDEFDDFLIGEKEDVLDDSMLDGDGKVPPMDRGQICQKAPQKSQNKTTHEKLHALQFTSFTVHIHLPRRKKDATP